MPKVRWGLSRGTIDDFDRDSQFAPYRGKTPPNAVYQWKIKKLQSVAGTREKNPQLRVGLELVPRERAESKYKGFYVMLFLPIADTTAFRYVPLLDAIGVSETDFNDRTIADENGNISRIGKWKNDGQTIIEGQLKDDEDAKGQPIKTIGWMGPPTEDDDEDADDDEDYYEEDDDGYDDDEVPF